jgi:hypothetical protein
MPLRPARDKPAASAETEHDRDHQEQRTGERGTGPHGEQPEHRQPGAGEAEAAGAGQAAVLLTPGVVHATCSLDERLGPEHPAMLPPLNDANRRGDGLHDHLDVALAATFTPHRDAAAETSMEPRWNLDLCRIRRTSQILACSILIEL